MNANPFKAESVFCRFGEAVGDWKENINNYERIQGILVDTRFLTYNYLTIAENHKNKLAETVERVS